MIDPLTDVAIRAGHRELLETLADFREAGRGPDSGTLEVETLRGMLAFLRERVIPFARWEESALLGADDRWDDAAFEHAFMAAEIDALAAAISRLLEAGVGEAVEAEIDRRLHRIGAVLELHVQKHDEREVRAPAPDAVGPRTTASTGMSYEMSASEIDGFLAGRTWGILSTLDAEGPYAVPISYGYDDGTLYFASGPGRKRDNLRARARVCFTVAEVETPERWRSVVARGRAEPVRGLVERGRALRALRRARGGGLDAHDLARLARATLFRLTPEERSGRERV